MSKLADAIRRTGKVESPQIGFSPVPTKKQSTMLLAALVADASTAAEGADIILAQSTAGKAPPTNGGRAQLRGAWLSEGATDVAAARQAGFDFVVFKGDEAPSSVLLEEEAGLVMQAPDELPDSLVQALQWL